MLVLGVGVLSCSAADPSGGSDDLGQTKQAAVFELVTDNLQALQLKSCIHAKGADACTRYPNPEGCTGVSIKVNPDGTVRGICEIDGKKRTMSSIAESLPILCNIGRASGRLRCIDIVGEVLLDKDPAGDDGDDISTTRAQALETDERTQTKAITKGCSVSDVLDIYAKKMNAVLANEGLARNYTPQVSEKSNAFKRAIAAGVAEYVSYGGSPFRDLFHLPTAITGKFCYAGGRMCRCARMAYKAMADTMAEKKSSCRNDKAWSTAVWLESGMSAMFIGEKAYKKSGSIMRPTASQDDSPPDESETPPDDSDSPPDDNGGGGGGGTTCVLSPLVLDLEGDGIHLSSMAQGVNFDLSGRGAVRTGWVQADDALLALDRNGNGTIDDGTELFGEAANLNNELSDDGFASLSLVDKRKHGGNEDGVVDSKDQLFAKLLVWSDRNGDGVSQAGEMRSLAQAGISRLMLSHEFNAGAIDAFGNHLGLTGAYVDQTGNRRSMIDVQFAYRAPKSSLHMFE